MNPQIGHLWLEIPCPLKWNHSLKPWWNVFNLFIVGTIWPRQRFVISIISGLVFHCGLWDERTWALSKHMGVSLINHHKQSILGTPFIEPPYVITKNMFPHARTKRAFMGYRNQIVDILRQPECVGRCCKVLVNCFGGGTFCVLVLKTLGWRSSEFPNSDLMFYSICFGDFCSNGMGIEELFKHFKPIPESNSKQNTVFP